MTISSIPLLHSIPCLGYSFILNRKPVFNPEKAEKLNIPKESWKKLHNGEKVIVNNKIIDTGMVTDSERKPIKLSYITDSMYFDDMIEFVKNSDLLICEGMYGDSNFSEIKKQIIMVDSFQSCAYGSIYLY